MAPVGPRKPVEHDARIQIPHPEPVEGGGSRIDRHMEKFTKLTGVAAPLMQPNRARTFSLSRTTGKSDGSGRNGLRLRNRCGAARGPTRRTRCHRRHPEARRRDRCLPGRRPPKPALDLPVALEQIRVTGNTYFRPLKASHHSEEFARTYCCRANSQVWQEPRVSPPALNARNQPRDHGGGRRQDQRCG